MDYEAVKVCRQYTESQEEIEQIREALFAAPEWILLDKGTITEDEAMERVKGRLPAPRLKELADLSMAHWHEVNIEPKPGMEELVKELKEQGYHIYLCSNVSLRFHAFKDCLPGIQYFDGLLISAEEKLIKPDPAIYWRLFEKFSIKPEESFFIDDLAENIESAKACGMDGYCFDHGKVGTLREHLKKRLNQEEK